MTSGVKQALPQVLMPKTGAEGKAVRNRAPQADFAEALGTGKFSRAAKSADVKADRAAADASPAWPRFASKLDNSIDRTRDVVSKPYEAVSSKEPTEGTSVDERETRHKGDVAEVTAISPTSSLPADAVSLPIDQPAYAATSAEAAAEVGTAPAPNAAVAHKKAADPDVTSEKAKSPPSASFDSGRKQDSTTPVFVPIGRGEQAEPIRFAPAAVTENTASADRRQAKEAQPDAPVEPAKTAPRVTVLAQQSIPAPMPQTSAVLVGSIAASDLLEPARTPVLLDAIHASATHASAQSLKIQLHPAELGMVTATLRFAGEQLSIELQVENHDAYRRLSGDSDTIVSSLRDLGYDVDRVTVLQPSIASTPAGRTDAGASMPSPQGRASEQFGSGTAGTGGGGTGGRQSGDGTNSGDNGRQGQAAAREQQGSGLYI